MLQDSFFYLARLGVGHSAYPVPKTIDWEQIHALAIRHELLAVVADGMDLLPDNLRPPKNLLLEWISEVLQNYECRYRQYCKAISELASFYNNHGYKIMLLKGYACSLDWPKPEHRPCGDIDIWQFGQQEEADALLESLNIQGVQKFKIDKSHHHHTVFNWGDFTVENHYDFINVHHHKSHVKLETILKEFAADDSHYIEMKGDSDGAAVEKVYLPSPNLNALFLMKHLMLHFSTGEITLRQVLDWAFFIEKHGKEVDWNKILGIYDEFHMREFFNCINAICVEELGFASGIFPYVQLNPFLKERVLNDILNPRFQGEMPSNLFLRIMWKIHRWKANEWKHDLCYEESMWSAFWSGVWGHLLKPASI